jgi:hypothetical protein
MNLMEAPRHREWSPPLLPVYLRLIQATSTNRAAFVAERERERERESNDCVSLPSGRIRTTAFLNKKRINIRVLGPFVSMSLCARIHIYFQIFIYIYISCEQICIG